MRAQKHEYDRSLAAKNELPFNFITVSRIKISSRREREHEDDRLDPFFFEF